MALSVMVKKYWRYGMHEYTEYTFRDIDGTWEWCTWDNAEDVLNFLKCREHTEAVVVQRKVITEDWKQQ